MIIESKKVILTTWETLEGGAGLFGYSDGRSFSRALKRGWVLGAHKEAGIWKSHPEGLVGPIANGRQFCSVPQGTGGVMLDVCSGVDSGQVVIGHTHLERKMAAVEVWAVPNSGVMAKVTCIAS